MLDENAIDAVGHILEAVDHLFQVVVDLGPDDEGQGVAAAVPALVGLVQRLHALVVEGVAVALEAVSLLTDLRKHRGRLNDLTEQIARLESDSDTLYDEGMKALYQAHRGGDAMAFMIGGEVYDHLEKVVDRFEDVANRISGILVEHL